MTLFQASAATKPKPEVASAVICLMTLLGRSLVDWGGLIFSYIILAGLGFDFQEGFLCFRNEVGVNRKVDGGVGGAGDLVAVKVWSQPAFDGQAFSALTAVVAAVAVDPDRRMKGKHGPAVGKTGKVDLAARGF